MKGLKPYPKYKDSGVDWLGNSPENWKVTNLKRIADISYGIGGEIDNSLTFGTNLLSLPNILINGNFLFEESFYATLNQNEKSALLLKFGDLLFNWRNGSSRHLGKTAFFNLTGEYTHVSFLLRIRFHTGYNPEYFFRFLNGLREDTFFSSSKAGVNNTFNQTELENLSIFVPPPLEQNAIADYLRKETARIDSLIDKKLRLIVLLKERRTALITQAVTKGLDPNVQLKDSGVEWLGEIPSHWEVKRLKLAVNHILRKNLNDDDFPYLGLENIESWTGRLIETENENESESLNSLFAAGDVLFGKLRPYLAKVLRADFDGQCTSELLVLRPKDLKKDFLFYILLSERIINLIDSSTYGAKMPRANWDFIGNIYFPIPSADEQRVIVSFIDRETVRIDSIIEKTTESIEKLKEYRSALISATVTGKIDVREVR